MSLRLAVAIAVAVTAAASSAAAQDAPDPAPKGPPKIVVVGDSTAAYYGPSRYPQLGWGQVLACSLDGQMEVIDLARGGRSTKSYIVEGLFSDMINKVAAGDTVLIQFGHNDESKDKPARYATPQMFYENLRAYVAMVRAKSAYPVLITPVQRRVFKKGHAQDAHTVYGPMVRKAARDTGAPLIDLSKTSRAWVERLGEEGSKAYFLHYTPEDKALAFPNGISDDTHFSEIGARGVAALIAADLARLPVPAAAHVRRGIDANATPVRLGGGGCP